MKKPRQLPHCTHLKLSKVVSLLLHTGILETQLNTGWQAWQQVFYPRNYPIGPKHGVKACNPVVGHVFCTYKALGPISSTKKKTSKHTCKHTYMNMNTHIHSCIHTYIHSHIHTYMHICAMWKEDTFKLQQKFRENTEHALTHSFP